jgi:multisubunit Na+/H+ antiporter MnhC subunit
MYIGTLDILAIIIAMSTSITVIVLAVRQNAELHKDNINLRRKLNMERIARDIRN